MSGLVLGKNGQVGRSLKSLLPDADYVDRSQLDMSEITKIREFVAERSPDFVVNAAAYTAVDAAEDEEELATRVNGKAVLELSAIATEMSIPLIHISTDYVFPGNATIPYSEGDATGPINAYGRSKLMGEQPFLPRSRANHILLRCSWVFSEYGNNFVKTMLRLAESEELRVVSDQLGRPTYAGDIAHVIAKLLTLLRRDGRVEPGVYHCASSGVTSWYGFAEEIFRRAARLEMIEREPKLEAIGTAEYPTPARRPRYSVLDTTKLEGLLGLEMPTWQVGLDGTLEALRRSHS